MRLLWISDSPDTPSGFGTVTRFVCAGLARLGHDVDVVGWQTTRGRRRHGTTLHPVRRHHLGSDALYAYLLERRPDAIVLLADVPWVPEIITPEVRRLVDLHAVPVVLYFPVDGARPDGRLPADWAAVLRDVDLPVAMSRYGVAVAARDAIPVEYQPHGVDLAVFRPPRDRERAKAAVGLAGRFVVLSDSRNQPRKMLPRLLDVFAAFAEGRPDAVLHLHTDPDDGRDAANYSYDLRADVARLGLGGRVRFTEGFRMRRGGGLSARALAALYRAADVHLLASLGEGFGLPTLQAAAAGAVPLAGAYSASHELVAGHGGAIAVGDWFEDEHGIRRGLVDVEDAVRLLARLHDDRVAWRASSAAAREFARAYAWGPIVRRWDSLLAALPERGPRAGEAVVRRAGPTTVTLTVARFADGRPRTDPRHRLGVPAGAAPHTVVAGPNADVAALRRIFPALRTTDRVAGASLVFDPLGELPAEVVLAAARAGVPYVGGSPFPEAARDAVALARQVLINPALARRTAESHLAHQEMTDAG